MEKGIRGARGARGMSKEKRGKQGKCAMDIRSVSVYIMSVCTSEGYQLYDNNNNRMNVIANLNSV